MRAVKYFGMEKLMKYFDKLNVSKDGKIIDVCAGTGGIIHELAKRGYSNLNAIDGSEGMLAKAKQEGNYNSYTHLLFAANSRMPFDNGEYDCVLLARVFLRQVTCHLKTLYEFCRVTVVGIVLFDPKYYEDKDKQYADGGFYKVVYAIKDKGYWEMRDGFPIPVSYIEYSDGFVVAFDVISK